MPTVLDNFIVIGKQDALRMGHDIRRMRRFGYIARAHCRRCGAILYVNTHSGKPVGGTAITQRCGEGISDGQAQPE